MRSEESTDNVEVVVEDSLPQSEVLDLEAEADNPDFEQEEEQDEAVCKEEWIKQICDEHGLDRETTLQCWEGFKSFDADGSGVMETSEMQVLLKVLGEEVSDSEFKKLLKKIDRDGSGTLDFIEFVDLFCTTPNQRGPVLLYKIQKISQKVQKTMQQQREDPAENALKKGVSEKYVKQYLRKEMDEADACLQLPWAVAMFMAFAISIITHESIPQLHIVDKSIETDIRENANFAFSGIIPYENGRMGHKGIDDVNNIPDFWSWLSLGLVPLLWVEAWDVSELKANALAQCTDAPGALSGFGVSPADANASLGSILPPLGWRISADQCPEPPPDEPPDAFFGSTKRGMYLYFQRVIGGVRFRQEARDETTCPGQEDVVAAVFGAGCFPGEYWLQPESHRGLSTNAELTDKSHSKTTYLKTGLSQAEIRTQLRTLEDEQWLSSRAQKVELSFVTYNANLHSLTFTYVNFFFSRTGHIWKQVEPVSIWLQPYHSWVNWISDGFWVAFTLRIFLLETKDIVAYIRQLGCRHGLAEYISFWNAVDWVSVIYGFVLFFLWYLQLMQISHVTDQLSTVNLKVTGGWEDEEIMKQFFMDSEETILSNIALRKVIAGYPFVIVGRFFKAFNAQPRLSMVTRTLSRATNDIFHFGIVFMSVFVAYVLSGLCLFGEELTDFADFDRSMNSCWRLLLGDFDWEELRVVGRLEAGLWFWSFSIMLMLIMLNMLLAIVMDFYTEVKASVGNAETLYSQSMELWNRFKSERLRHRLSLGTVLWVLDPTDLDADDEDEGEEVFLTPESFYQRIVESGMDKKLSAPTAEKDWLREQIDEILVNTNVLVKENEREDVCLSDAFVCVQEMSERQKHLHQSMEQLVHLCTMMSDRCSPPSKPSAVQAVVAPPKENRPPDLQSTKVMDPLVAAKGAVAATVDPEEVVQALRSLVATKLPSTMDQLLLTRVQPAMEVLRQSRDAVIERSQAMQKAMDRHYSDLEVKAKQLQEELDMLRSCGDDEFAPLRRKRVSVAPTPWSLHKGGQDYNTVYSHSVPQGVG